MAELSPAAQAVLTAFAKYPLHGDHIAETLTHGALPAALKAAVDQIEDLYCDGDVEDSPGVVFALHQLMLIADELEGQ
jgi:hypothetical protein